MLVPQIGHAVVRIIQAIYIAGMVSFISPDTFVDIYPRFLFVFNELIDIKRELEWI